MQTNSINSAIQYLADRGALPKLAQPVPAIGSDARFATFCQLLLLRSARLAGRGTLPAGQSAPFKLVG
jgi:hypothetical protein